MRRRTAIAGLAATGLCVSARGGPADVAAQIAAVRSVSVRDFGAHGDGRADDTQSLQSAIDALPEGGEIVIPAGTYFIRRLNVRTRGITITLDPRATLRRTADGPEAGRGMIHVENMIDAAFMLRGGTIDLMGEGPKRIGAPGLIPNRYSTQTVSSVVAIAGPNNAAVYALRSTGLAVEGVTIRNTGESGLLFRNCGQVSVSSCRFSNIANYGVEFSFVATDQDGGSGAMPARDHCAVRDCTFEDIDDFGLGSGNGVGVGGGGAANLGAFAHYEVTDCSFSRCQQDVHFEFLAGSYLTDVVYRRLRSEGALQTSLTLVGVERALIEDCTIRNAGAAPSIALSPEYPTVCGVALSSHFVDVVLRRVAVIDDRASSVVAGVGASIDRRGLTLQVGSAVFRADDKGKVIGIRGANPGGACYVGTIAEILSPTSVLLSQPAGATVRNADFAFGGATREGMRFFHGTSVTLNNVRIQAGSASKVAHEPPPAGLTVEGVPRLEVTGDVLIAAPRNGMSNPSGIRARNVIPRALVERAVIRGYSRPLTTWVG